MTMRVASEVAAVAEAVDLAVIEEVIEVDEVVVWAATEEATGEAVALEATVEDEAADSVAIVEIVEIVDSIEADEVVDLAEDLAKMPAFKKLHFVWHGVYTRRLVWMYFGCHTLFVVSISSELGLYNKALQGARKRAKIRTRVSEMYERECEGKFEMRAKHVGLVTGVLLGWVRRIIAERLDLGAGYFVGRLARRRPLDEGVL